MAIRFGDLTKKQKDKIRNKPGNKGLTKKEVRDKYNKKQEKKYSQPMGPAIPEGYDVPEPSPAPFNIEWNSNTGGFNFVSNTPPEPTPAPTPAPTPEPTPPPYTPSSLFDPDALMESLNEALAGINENTKGIIGDLTTGFGDQIGDLTEGFNTTISGLQDSINNQADVYKGTIGGLQDQLVSNQDTLNTYATQISSLGDQLRDAQQQARQVKTTDTTYVGDNTASGVRFNRSNNYNRGAFALGTSQLNRDNMNKLFKIGTVNL
tara:strand:- start:1536 stop:2324 length:789 start_codon:yes stop_codon:yes gene_type:complete